MTQVNLSESCDVIALKTQSLSLPPPPSRRSRQRKNSFLLISPKSGTLQPGRQIPESVSLQKCLVTNDKHSGGPLLICRFVAIDWCESAEAELVFMMWMGFFLRVSTHALVTQMMINIAACLPLFAPGERNGDNVHIPDVTGAPPGVAPGPGADLWA